MSLLERLGIERKEAAGDQPKGRFTRRLSLMQTGELLDWADTTGTRIALALQHTRRGQIEPEVGIGEAISNHEVLGAILEEIRLRQARGTL